MLTSHKRNTGDQTLSGRCQELVRVVNVKGSGRMARLVSQVFIVLMVCMTGVGCAMKRISLPEAEPAVFSWGVESSRDTAFLADLGVRAIFQEIERGQEAEVLESLVDVDVYLLTGSPDMGLAEMCAEIERAAEGFNGVVFDIEPYGQAGWAEADVRTQILDDFCDAVESAYDYACDRGVEMLLCVPYWYDELGYDEQLERLVGNCDGVCVMNYDRGHEAENVAGEAELAVRYQRRLWTIYELSPADGESVQACNTYFGQGLAAVLENYRANFSDTDIALAYHDIDHLRALVEREN